MKLIVNWLIPILCSIYIALAIGQYFAPTGFRYLFLGFMSFFIVKLYLKTYTEKHKGISFNKKRLIVGLIVSAVIVGVGRNYVVPEVIRSKKIADITVTALGKKNNKSKGYEIWLKEIKGGPVDLNSLPPDSGWKRKDNSLYAGDHFPAILHLKFDIVSNKASLSFLKHEWSGLVQITNGKQEDVIDLYATPSSEYKYPIDVKQATVINVSVIWRVIGYILSFLFFAIAVYFIGNSGKQ